MGSFRCLRAEGVDVSESLAEFRLPGTRYALSIFSTMAYWGTAFVDGPLSRTSVTVPGVVGFHVYTSLS